jgi:hypothetical protein
MGLIISNPDCGTCGLPIVYCQCGRGTCPTCRQPGVLCRCVYGKRRGSRRRPRRRA